MDIALKRYHFVADESCVAVAVAVAVMVMVMVMVIALQARGPVAQ
jgi:hypothetical protein